MRLARPSFPRRLRLPVFLIGLLPVAIATEDCRPVLVAEKVGRLTLDDFDYDEPEQSPEGDRAFHLEGVKRLVGHDMKAEDLQP